MLLRVRSHCLSISLTFKAASPSLPSPPPPCLPLQLEYTHGKDSRAHFFAYKQKKVQRALGSDLGMKTLKVCLLPLPSQDLAPAFTPHLCYTPAAFPPVGLCCVYA